MIIRIYPEARLKEIESVLQSLLNSKYEVDQALRHCLNEIRLIKIEDKILKLENRRYLYKQAF